MVKWFQEEVDLVDKVYNVPVEELEYKDDDGKIIKTIPVKDLTNKEVMLLQTDPFLKDYTGDISSALSPKAQAFGILMTFHRMYKANQELGFNVHTMLKWSTARTSRLIVLINNHLDKVEKKSESTPSPMRDSSSDKL